MKGEVNRLQELKKDLESYGPENADSVISKLEALQQKQQAIEAKKESVSSELLTREQESFPMNRREKRFFKSAATLPGSKRKYRD